jgi:hypothetical protein
LETDAGWKETKSALVIVGMFGESLGEGPKFSAVVSKVSRSSEKVFVLAEASDGEKKEIELELCSSSAPTTQTLVNQLRF